MRKQVARSFGVPGLVEATLDLIKVCVGHMPIRDEHRKPGFVVQLLLSAEFFSSPHAKIVGRI